MIVGTESSGPVTMAGWLALCSRNVIRVMNNVIGEQSVLLIDHNQQGNQCKLFPLIAIEHSTAHKRGR